MFDKPTSPGSIRLVHGSMPVSHRYTAGLGGERFFRALAERGVFLATRCTACSVAYCPARTFCERCLAALDEEVEVGPHGSLESFTVMRIGLDSQRLPEPVNVGLIRLQGADTCLVHRIVAGPQPGAGTLAIGMIVEPVLRGSAERVGSLDDVEHFRPVP